MDLQASFAPRTQKVFEDALKNYTGLNGSVNVGNVDSMNRVFVRVTIKQALPSGRFEVYATPNAQPSIFMPINIVTASSANTNTYYALVNPGEYVLEIDSSLYKTCSVYVKSTVSNIAFADYVKVDICATPLLTSPYGLSFREKVPASATLNVPQTVVASGANIFTGDRTLLRLDITVNSALTSYSNIIVKDVNTGKNLTPFTSLEKAKQATPIISNADGAYARLYNTGSYVFFYDISQSNAILLTYTEPTKLSVKYTQQYGLINIDTNTTPVAYLGKTFKLETISRQVFDCDKNTFIFGTFPATSLSVSFNGMDGEASVVAFTSANFPNLKAGSKIYSAHVVPYMEATTFRSRVVVITDKGQIYHNRPLRPSGNIAGDDLLFDESVIWDLPIGVTSRRYPSLNPSESRAGFRYFPYLPASSYSYVTPVGQDNGYGNGGFPETIGTGQNLRTRFYQFKEPSEGSVDVPFHHIQSGYARKRKTTAFGNYQGYGSRPCVFATDDGGRSWFVTYEFDSYVSFGNNINTIDAGSYTSGSFAIQKRNAIYPSAADKEPVNKWSYGSEILVTGITNANPAVVTTATPHGLTNGALDKAKIRFVRKTSGSDGFAPMLNDSANENSAGTGVFFNVNVLSPTTFELKEYIYNPSADLQCRHIHYTNPLKDFIAFGCGEEYPNGWNMLMDNKATDAFASENFAGSNPKSYRLNSAENSPQRLCGFGMYDDDSQNPTMLLGLDTAWLNRGEMVIPGRTGLPRRSSAGIFKMKLSDIDDPTKMVSVFDIEQSLIYMQKYGAVRVAGFQSGANAVSADDGESWELLDLGAQIKAAGIGIDGYIYFTNYFRLTPR